MFCVAAGINMRTHFASILAVGIILVAWTSSAVETVVPTPVKPEQLDGTRLVYRPAFCSIDTPGREWKWMTLDSGKGKTFMCFNSRNSTFFVVSSGTLNHPPLTDHHPQSLIAGAKKSMVTKGGTIEDDKYEFVDAPAASKAALITFDEVDAHGKRSPVVIYVLHMGEQMLLKLQCNSAGTAAAMKTSFESILRLNAVPAKGKSGEKP
jgi:hypothetical protein